MAGEDEGVQELVGKTEAGASWLACRMRTKVRAERH